MQLVCVCVAPDLVRKLPRKGFDNLLEHIRSDKKPRPDGSWSWFLTEKKKKTIPIIPSTVLLQGFHRPSPSPFNYCKSLVSKHSERGNEEASPRQEPLLTENRHRSYGNVGGMLNKFWVAFAQQLSMLLMSWFRNKGVCDCTSWGRRGINHQGWAWV